MSSGIANGAVSTIPTTNPVTAAASLTGGQPLIYTVPAGKTFYCTGLSVAYNGTAGALALFDLQIDAATIMLIQLVGDELGTVMYGQPLFAATSGEQIESNGIAAGTYYVNLWGYLL